MQFSEKDSYGSVRKLINLRVPLDLRIIFSRKVFCGATNPRRVPLGMTGCGSLAVGWTWGQVYRAPRMGNNPRMLPRQPDSHWWQVYNSMATIVLQKTNPQKSTLAHVGAVLVCKLGRSFVYFHLPALYTLLELGSDVASHGNWIINRACVHLPRRLRIGQHPAAHLIPKTCVRQWSNMHVLFPIMYLCTTFST